VHSEYRRILDISPLLSERVAVWPGDTPFRRTTNLSIDGGANIDLSDIHTTVHVGAHTDSPSHYVAGGQSIDQRPLDLYLGPCQVIAVSLPRGARIQPEHLPGGTLAPRVLFKTGSFPDPDHFNEDFAALSGPLIHELARQGVRLVGIDTPSIDLCHDKVLESHQAVAAHDLAVLEGIVLDAVEPGAYTLVALPLAIEGSDASPVRAVLLQT
jgi:arylformamidase